MSRCSDNQSIWICEVRICEGLLYLAYHTMNGVARYSSALIFRSIAMGLFSYVKARLLEVWHYPIANHIIHSSINC
jgi:hypothetical protein